MKSELKKLSKDQYKYENDIRLYIILAMLIIIGDMTSRYETYYPPQFKEGAAYPEYAASSFLGLYLASVFILLFAVVYISVKYTIKTWSGSQNIKE